MAVSKLTIYVEDGEKVMEDLRELGNLLRQGKTFHIIVHMKGEENTDKYADSMKAVLISAMSVASRPVH